MEKNRIFGNKLLGIIGSIASIIALLIFFFPKKDDKAQVLFEILSSTNVLDINEDVSDLKILFKGEDLSDKRENLRIVLLRIRNSGNINLKEKDFARNDPLGIKISNSKLIRLPDIVETSDSTIIDNVKISLDSLENVYFSDFMFDKSEYFTLKLVLLHKADETPMLSPVGRVSGIKEIRLVEIENSRNSQTDDDSFPIYFFIIMIVVLVGGNILFEILVPSIKGFYNKKITKRKRKKIIKDFIESQSSELHEEDDIIFKLFLDKGSLIYDLAFFLESTTRVNSLLKGIDLSPFKIENNPNPDILKFFIEKNSLEWLFEYIPQSIITNSDYVKKNLKNHAFLFIKDDEVIINENQKNVLLTFRDFARFNESKENKENKENKD